MLITTPIYALLSTFVLLTLMIVWLSGGEGVSREILIALSLLLLPLSSSLKTLRDTRVSLEFLIYRVDIYLGILVFFILFMLLGVSLELVLIVLFLVISCMPLTQKGCMALAGVGVSAGVLLALLGSPEIATLVFGIALYALIVYILREFFPALRYDMSQRVIFSYIYYAAIYGVVILLIFASYREIELLYYIIALVGIAFLHNLLSVHTPPRIAKFAGYISILMLVVIYSVPLLSSSGLSGDIQSILLGVIVPMTLVFTALWNRLLHSS